MEPMDRTENLLRNALRAAVPMWALEVQRYSEKEREARQSLCAQTVASKGDVLLFGGKPGQAGEAFNRLAEGIAILCMIAKGGVTLFGLHFEMHRKTGYFRIDEVLE